MGMKVLIENLCNSPMLAYDNMPELEIVPGPPNKLSR